MFYVTLKLVVIQMFIKKGTFMKNFKNILAVAALFAIVSVNAKRTAAPVTRPGVTPTGYNKPLPGIPAYDQPLPAIPAYDKPLPPVPFATTAANATMEAELKKIEKIQNNIKNAVSRVLKDTKISVADKNQFMKRVQNTYAVITESCNEDFIDLQNMINNQ